MTDKVEDAIRGSIAKWEAIVAGTGTDDGCANCPLCQLFYRDCCAGCPVAERTETDGCHGSPYDQWAKERISENAKAELDFLRSILVEHLETAAS